MKILKGVVSVRFNWRRVVCIFSGGCIEDPEELEICMLDNMVGLYCGRCGSLIRHTPLHDITDPKVLETLEDLMEEDD